MDAWFNEIDRATTEAQIVTSARDFCALVSPRDLAPLPETIRSIRIDSDADIPRLREKLAKGYAEMSSDAPDVEKLRDLLSYLSRASDRLRQIRPTSAP